MGKREVPAIQAVHVYFHREELEELQRLGAANDLSVRAVVRMVVRDYLIRKPDIVLQTQRLQPWKVAQNG